MTPEHPRIGHWLVMGLLSLMAGCSPNHGGPPGQVGTNAPEQAVVSVKLVKPEKKALVRLIEQPAHIEAFEETPLVNRISGYIQKVKVDIGDRVQTGQVLAELSVPELEEELHQKKALVAQANAEVEQDAAA